jgi:hypothetical protein
MIRAITARIICRRRGHHWTTKAEPPFCLRCHRTGWAA